MKLRNGDIGFFKVKRGQPFRYNAWIAAGISLLITLVASTVVMIGVSIYRSPFIGMWLIWTGWAYSIPGAYFGGLRARDNEEPTYYALAAGAGVAIVPLMCGALPILVSLGLGSFVTALFVSHVVYQVRRLRGDRPELASARYSSLKCVNCGYWLPGLAEHRCPECGTPFGRQDV